MLALTLSLFASPALADDAPRAEPEAAAPASADTETVTGRVTILPGVGFHASPTASVDGFSIGLAGRARAVDGLDVQALGSWVDEDVDGLQAAGLGAVARDVDGVQATGFVGVARDVDGVQVSGGIAVAHDVDVQGGAMLSVATGEVRWAQLSGGVNIARENVRGVQASGMVNIAGGDDSRGAQLSGGLNLAEGISGLQAAPVNVGDEVRGAQIGLVNIGRKVDGTQVGLVNIAKEANGASIAPLNFIGNGMFHVDVWASDTTAATAGVKFGSRHMYTILAAGYVRPGDPWWSWGGGLGAMIPGGPGWLSVDATAWGVSSGLEVVPGVLGKLRLNAGLSVAKRLSPFVGVSANTWVGDGTVWPRVVGLPSGRRHGRQVVSWPGLHAGIQF